MRGKWLLALLALWLAWPACTTDHSPLVRRKDGGASGGGRPALPGAGRGGALVITGGTSSGGTGGREPDEPPGTNVLTIVHGIVDAETVRLCFRAGRPGEERYVETPEGAESLEFGNKIVVRELDGVDFSEDDLAPLAITGELSLVEELDCADAVERALEEQSAGMPPEPSGGAGGAGGAAGAGGTGGAAGGNLGFALDEVELGGAGGAAGAGGAEPSPPEPPRLRVGELPAVPAGTLSSGRSFLLVMNGCIGGPAFVGRLADDACGPEYTPARPTLGAAFAAVSRKSQTISLGLQVLHASLASDRLAVQSAQFPVGSQVSPLVVSEVYPGVLAPRVPRLDLDRAVWGAGLPGWRIEVISGGTVVLGVPWADALARAGLESIETGKNYVIVVIGPRLDLGSKGFWNPPTVTVVESDPADQ